MAKTKKKKLSFQRRTTQKETERTPNASAGSTSQPAGISTTSTGASNTSSAADLTNLTFEKFKALGLDESQQRNLIGQIRNEVPPNEVHDVGTWLLDSLAKQLRLCIFPTAQMMHIDPAAVKRMLDNEFREAYGSEVEANMPRPGKKPSM